ncbi:MAG: 50S ribosomal protein L16 [Puniceicoccales bacterium]|nr:50S ribosomal protein L16 [Puniceicoccales bacterium]
MSKLSPARTRYRKVQKGRNRGDARGGDFLAFGDCGLQSLGRGSMSAAQIEAARVAISRHLKRKGKLWVRIFPHIPVTKKPAETRMGKGKGAVEYWAAAVKPGIILFELAGISINLAREAFRLADFKIPFRCRFVNREELESY